MGAMKEAFKLKVFPLSKLQEIMLLDTEEQVRAWLMREGADVVVTGDGQDAEATFPAKAWPRGKGLTVSEQILRKRNGVLSSHIHVHCFIELVFSCTCCARHVLLVQANATLWTQWEWLWCR